MKAKLLVIISMAFSMLALGQSIKTLEYDMGKGKFNGLLPFDQAFNLKLTNIAKDKDHLPDSIAVRLIEVPKKNYDKIAKAKRKLALSDPSINAHVVTAADVNIFNRDKFNYTQDKFYFFMLDTMLRGVNLADTFYNLSVPFYLKPESKYLIDIRSYDNRQLTDAEQTQLEDFIKNNRLFKQTLNQELIIPNILNPDVTAGTWGNYTNRLQAIAQRAIQAKYRNYTLSPFDYPQQLERLSDLLLNLNNLNGEITFLQSAVTPPSANLTQVALVSIQKKHKDLIDSLASINWMQLEKNDRVYKKIINQTESLLANDSTLLLNTPNRIYIEKGRKKIAENLDAAINIKNAFVIANASFISSYANNYSIIASTNQESLVEQAKLHVAFDLGYAYVGQIDRGNAYAALHIYFRSIDTSLPLKNYKLKFWDFIGARTSFLIGTSVQSIQKDSVRKGIINNDMAIVTGLGFRLLPWFRINGGAYLYYLYDQNPLRTKKDYSFKASPFFSVSIDFNLSSFLGTFGNGNLFNNIFKK